MSTVAAIEAFRDDRWLVRVDSIDEDAEEEEIEGRCDVVAFAEHMEHLNIVGIVNATVSI